MKVQKTIKAKIIQLTNRKNELITKEYNNFQKLLESLQTNMPICTDTYDQIELYSATKQNALRLIKRTKGKLQEQPLIIRRDVFKVVHNDNKISNFWVKLPISGLHGGLWVPIQLADKHKELLTLSIRQSMLIKRKHEWFIHITIEKEVKINETKSPTILSIDLGERFAAASVEYIKGTINHPKLYGRKIRGIRRHYNWLRKRLGNRRKLRAIKRISQKEQRITNDLLHKISNDIVKQTIQLNNTVIVVGDLKGIRSRAKGKRFNRIVSSMAYHKLTKYIEYKANWEGIKVIKISEAYTSKTCYRCKNIGKRPSQGLFKCPSCGLQYNADINAAINLAERFSDQWLESGGALNRPLNKAIN